ncbi:luciferase monooxygenase [Natrinema limicola JCM 13563]|uniref:Luciferase monooxygenase n=1 Tax=Natrinema limicola JCM 13563 TaxID=1230457 RepID=M0CDT4_9EURY|nr:luciferase monooxygenase [Natrinema limicola JCM 13563]
MQLGTGLFTCQQRPDDDRWMSEIYDEMLEFGRVIDDAGLDSAWVSEHHFLDDGYMSGISPALGALAAVTDDIELGPCIALAPLYDSVRLAEDVATIDQIADGRTDDARSLDRLERRRVRRVRHLQGRASRPADRHRQRASRCVVGGDTRLRARFPRDLGRRRRDAETGPRRTDHARRRCQARRSAGRPHRRRLVCTLGHLARGRPQAHGGHRDRPRAREHRRRLSGVRPPARVRQRLPRRSLGGDARRLLLHPAPVRGDLLRRTCRRTVRRAQTGTQRAGDLRHARTGRRRTRDLPRDARRRHSLHLPDVPPRCRYRGDGRVYPSTRRRSPPRTCLIRAAVTERRICMMCHGFTGTD